MALIYRSTRDRRAEIGFTMAPAFAGRGLATEGALALLAIGFEAAGFHRIEGQCDARNAASTRHGEDRDEKGGSPS